jgi:hypothetical protein
MVSFMGGLRNATPAQHAVVTQLAILTAPQFYDKILADPITSPFFKNIDMKKQKVQHPAGARCNLATRCHRPTSRGAEPPITPSPAPAIAIARVGQADGFHDPGVWWAPGVQGAQHVRGAAAAHNKRHGAA